MRAFTETGEDRTGRLMVAAWDYGLNTARLFFITSDVVVGPAFEPAEALHLVSGGTGSDAYRRFVESGNQPKHMQGLIAVQRKERWNVPGFAPGHFVGGEVVRHAVTAEGVRPVIVSQWHDRVGQRIKGGLDVYDLGFWIEGALDRTLTQASLFSNLPCDALLPVAFPVLPLTFNCDILTRLNVALLSQQFRIPPDMFVALILSQVMTVQVLWLGYSAPAIILRTASGLVG